MEPLTPARIAANVERLLAEQGMKAAELSRRSGIQPPHISRLLSGKQPPNLDTISRVAAALGVTEADLLRRDGAGPLGVPVPIGQLVRVPLLGTVGAGPATDDPEPDGSVVWLDGPVTGQVVCYRVKGDSLAGELVGDGDLIFVRLDPAPQPGELVVVWLDDDGGLVAKELVVRGKKQYLAVPGPDGRPGQRPLGPADVVYGVLVFSRRDHTRRSRHRRRR